MSKLVIDFHHETLCDGGKVLIRGLDDVYWVDDLETAKCVLMAELEEAFKNG
jgi:hypothetical protein